MFYLIFFVGSVLCFFSVTFRVALFHLPQVFYNGIIDLYDYFRYRKWNYCKTGSIICYVGLFGKGKTLSAVHHVCQLYRRYNGRMVWDPGRKKWVRQVVQVISNVDLSIPFIRFYSLGQMVAVSEHQLAIDDHNDTMTVTIVLGDEFSVQLNSRKFKENIDPLFLNTLLTCRHHHISLVYTSQRFGHVDALLRQVTSYVISCDKLWRIVRHGKYDAFDLENATNIALVRPLSRFGWFVCNRDYDAYDTLACVGNLSKSCKEGDMISSREILELQQLNSIQMEAVGSPSRKFFKNMRKTKK